MCDAEDKLWDVESDLKALQTKYEELGGDAEWAECDEPTGVRARLVRAGLVEQGEAYPPLADLPSFRSLALLVLERALAAAEAAAATQ